jgi:predicted nucleic acid-binding protein
MARYLVDTNLLLRAVQLESEDNELASDAISSLFASRHRVYVTPQVLIEFWAVGTRPIEVNGLAMSVSDIRAHVESFLRRFDLLPDSPTIFEQWIDLVAKHQRRGKQVHDARLVAVMKAHGVENLLTFNVDDFAGYNEIKAVHPRDVK